MDFSESEAESAVAVPKKTLPARERKPVVYAVESDEEDELDDELDDDDAASSFDEEEDEESESDYESD